MKARITCPYCGTKTEIEVEELRNISNLVNCTVVYIHPAGRYCVLEFDVGRREPVTIRESFQLIDGRVAE